MHHSHLASLGTSVCRPQRCGRAAGPLRLGHMGTRDRARVYSMHRSLKMTLDGGGVSTIHTIGASVKENPAYFISRWKSDSN